MIKTATMCGIAFLTLSASTVLAADDSKMSKSDMDMMKKCKAMSQSEMQKNKDCEAMMKEHPDMMKSDTTGSSGSMNNGMKK